MVRYRYRTRYRQRPQYYFHYLFFFSRTYVHRWYRYGTIFIIFFLYFPLFLWKEIRLQTTLFNKFLHAPKNSKEEGKQFSNKTYVNSKVITGRDLSFDIKIVKNIIICQYRTNRRYLPISYLKRQNIYTTKQFYRIYVRTHVLHQ